jgi:hypothetical protein
VALIHHPVVDKNGQTIAAAVTALDLHDIARASKTYGVDAFYVVTPLEDQQELVRQIIDHWVAGAGARYNPDRRAALALIQLKPSLESVVADMTERFDMPPATIATSAKRASNNLNFDDLLGVIRDDRPTLLLFGTAWGLAPEVMDQVDFRLDPIEGNGGYNHLSVRSAVSIILDRMFR